MKDDETRKKKQNNKTAILDKLKDSIVSEEVDSMGVEDLSRNVDNSDDAAEGIIFKKYKENSKFTGAVGKFKISKATINFKIGIIKFIDDYPKMRKSSISLHFLKNNFRVIKDVCKEYFSEFQ